MRFNILHFDRWLINSCGYDDRQSSAVLFAVTCAADFIISVYHMELICEVGVRARAMLQGSIFKKVTWNLSILAQSKAHALFISPKATKAFVGG